MGIIHGTDDNGNEMPIRIDSAGGLSPAHQAGEEQAESKYGSMLRVTKSWKWATSTSGSGDFTVYNGPCRIGRIISSAAIDVYAKDGTSTLTTPLAVGARGFTDGLMETECHDSGIINRSATAIISVAYKEAQYSD